MSAAAKTLTPVPANRRVERKALTGPPLAAPQPRSPDKHTVHWFRKGLRLHDNPALREGLAGACTFRCIFIIDPWFASSSNVGINKWRLDLQD
ncbi:Cryptochrome-1 [Eumeta japonica]|uniref:Cryptochrome-1 n=1 Tax=Eumeta variegata TaxID=151549 RepID=A0A4C1ZEE8_EUMVA|nr:Cryptochrome-1 [Eumeta japonica]